MNPILDTEFDNTIGQYQKRTYTNHLGNSSPVPRAIYGCSYTHGHKNPSLEIDIHLNVPTEGRDVFKDAIVKYLKPCLLPNESMRCLLNVNNQRVTIQARCTPVTFHTELINKELEERVLVLVTKAEKP